MKKLAFAYIIISLITCSCQNKNVQDKLEGVWFSEQNSLNLFSIGFQKFESDSFRIFPQIFPVLYDFKNDGVLLMKNLERKDTTFQWFMKSDTVITINNLDFHIKLIGNDSLKLTYRDKNDISEFSFIKPRKLKIKENENEIKNILLSNVWSVTDTSSGSFEKHFEYLDNKTVIYRDKFFDHKLNKITDNIQVETWGVTKYKEYVFLYNYMNIKIGIGNWNSMRQISQINDSTYSLIDSYNKTEINYRRKENYSNKETTERILGNWKSKNNLDQIYGPYNINAVKQGRMKLFEGDLELHISANKLTFLIKDYNPNEYNWQISKDSKTLIIESEWNEYWPGGIHVECADILELTDKKLKIRLFNNFYFLENLKPQMYILNIIQEFERIE
ncbi:MAG TPA: hypothetical protein P5084_00990 [Paludibacter sp.]|nr:hypothetical protein [Paludibacter sp.]